MRACWLKWVGRDWSISADYIWLNYSGANNGMAGSFQGVFIFCIACNLMIVAFAIVSGFLNKAAEK